MNRSIWTRQMPAQMQTLLAMQKDRSLSEVTEMADTVFDMTGSEQISAIQAPPPPQVSALEARLDEMSRQLSKLLDDDNGRSRSRNCSKNRRGRLRSRAKNQQENTDLCWYHDCFGDKARKCKPPSKFSSGNGEATR